MSKTMKAMVYHGANDIRFEERPRPEILQPTDAVIRLTKTGKVKTQKFKTLQLPRQGYLMAGF